MPYLVADDMPDQPAGARFRALLDRPGILQMPGTHNGMAALQAKAAGFDACYLSGAAMTASMGLPDLGVITVDEVCFFVRQVTRASGLPVLVDGDTGLWRGAERHGHGARVRGCGRGGGAYRGPGAAEEMRAPER